MKKNSYVVGSYRLIKNRICLCCVDRDEKDLLTSSPAAFRTWATKQAAHQWLSRKGYNLSVLPLSRVIHSHEGMDIFYRAMPRPAAAAPEQLEAPPT